MKVIKKGKDINFKWSKELTCTGIDGCEAILLVEYSDLFKNYFSRRDNIYTVAFKCPECGQIVSLGNYSELPSNVVEFLPHSYQHFLKGKNREVMELSPETYKDR